MLRSPQDLYARQLSSTYGYPLWTPEPSSEFLIERPEGLRIGDVGVVIPDDGGFDAFFNLCLPRNHRFHTRHGVPDSFICIRPEELEIRTLPAAEPDGQVILTPSVTQLGPVSSTEPPRRGEPGISTYRFNLSSDEGALLILPEGAEKHELLNDGLFVKKASQNGAEWYNYAINRRHRIINQDALYVITGLYKTHSWSVAALGNVAGNESYVAQYKHIQYRNSTTATSGWDTTRGGLRWRAGSSVDYVMPSQTVFIRGLKIALRNGFLGSRWVSVEADTPSTARSDPVKSLSVVPSDSQLRDYLAILMNTSRTTMQAGWSSDAAEEQAQSNSNMSDQGGHEGIDVGVERVPNVPPAFHPSNAINQYLLRKDPSAKIAITSDSIWISILEDKSLTIEEFDRDSRVEKVLSQNYHIVSQEGAVRLEKIAGRQDPSSPLSPSFNLPADEADARINMLTRELSNMTLQSEEGLRRFQRGELAEKDDEWYHLVPAEAREVLGKREVERQSVLFEVFKSERDYVADLKLIKEVFADPLASASPPIVGDANRQRNFLYIVFWNLEQICMRHEHMLVGLFERQQEQHPLVQSVSDIILESVFQFQGDYESYIKHYPLAEQRHRTELKYNKHYQEFMQQCSQDPRVRKRDLITFLSRPVTRLPRLNLMLEHIHKLTDAHHSDSEDLPVILSILNGFLRSSQPGIEATENKVKFWDLCESLVFNKGEIIELDWYSDSRSLIYAGVVARRSKPWMEPESWFDHYVVLLDNFVLITDEKKRGGVTKRLVVSRPIPLEYLRLGSFDDPPESMEGRVDEGSILDSFPGAYRSVYPFTIYHVFDKLARRYTLYTASESIRKKWQDALVNAKAVNDVKRDGNQWFVTQLLEDGPFRVPGPRMLSDTTLKRPPSGRVIQAVSFVTSGGRTFMAVGCSTGIFVGRQGENYRRILPFEDIKNIIALQGCNKFIIHQDGCLLSYSLEVLAQVAQIQAPPSSLNASLETIAGQNSNVLCCYAGEMGDRTIILYAVRESLGAAVHALEAIHPSEITMSSSGVAHGSLLSFQPYGKTLYIPMETFAIFPLAKTICICTERGVVITNLSNSSSSGVTIVPDFSGAAQNTSVADLKSHCKAARPIGLIRLDSSELMVIYDTMGCYITKYGQPTRDSTFIRWEIKANSFIYRAPNILLFSSEFIEVRDAQTGLLRQVIEGVDIRLLVQGPVSEGPLFVAMRGQKDDEDGLSDRIVELVETV